MDSAQLILALLFVMAAGGIVVRGRHNLGRRLLRPRHLVVRLALLVAAIAAVTIAAFPHLTSLEAELGGLSLGVLLAFVGLKLTRFEMTTEGNFYIPNAGLGVALLLVLAGRLAYRGLTLAQSSGGVGRAVPGLLQCPITVLIFGVTVGYYLTYTTGILVRGRKLI